MSWRMSKSAWSILRGVSAEAWSSADSPSRAIVIEPAVILYCCMMTATADKIPTIPASSLR
jgi:hypothetical protein